MPPSKTQAQKKAEHAERAAALAAQREAEKRQRDEFMRQQAAATKADQQQKKNKDKDKKNSKSASSSTSGCSSLLPSAAEVAQMGQHGPGADREPRELAAGTAAGDADADAAESKAAFAAAAAAELSSLQLAGSGSGSGPSPSHGAGVAVASPTASARLVLNHSTHIEGLLPFMVRLQKSPLVKTILPGAICGHSGQGSHAPHLQVVYQSESNDGAWNFVAKHGYSRQDLRITPKLKLVKRSMVEEAISDILSPASRQQTESHSHAHASASSGGLLAPNANRFAAEMAAKERRAQDHAKHAAIKDKEAAAAHAKRVAEKAKKLKAAIGQKNESVQAYAEEWVKWEK